MGRAIRREEVLSVTEGGLAVFRHYMPFAFEPEKMFRNPCYDDRRASAHIHFHRKSQQWMLHDFGDESYTMDCFSFCAWACQLDVRRDFPSVLARIDADLGLGLASDAPAAAPGGEGGKPERPAPPAAASAEAPRYEVEYAPWTPQALAFWSSYGIDAATLANYDVRCVRQFSSVGSSGKPYRLVSSIGDPIFAYDQQGFVKLYRPLSSTARFLYGGAKPSDYCFGRPQLPHRGRLLVITGGEKDVLSLASHGFHAVCFNSETSRPSEALLSELRGRFDDIAVLYDMDETGVRASQALVDQLGGWAVRVQLPLDGSRHRKDVSDYFRDGGTRQALFALFQSQIRLKYAPRRLQFEKQSLSLDRPPRESRTLFSYHGMSLGKPGQLVCISGKPGVGKTHLMGALVSGCLADRKLVSNKTLGIDVRNNEGHAAVLHFDTEQSESQVFSNAVITMRRAGLLRQPDFYKCFPLVGSGLTIPELRAHVEEVIRVCYWEYGGAHAVFIDGVADLVCNPNDEQESTAVVQWLLSLAERYETCVVVMMHLLPNGEKIRGHLGSILERKCSSILAVERPPKGETNLYRATKLREGNLLAVSGVEFSWSESQGMMHLVKEETPEEFLFHHVASMKACLRRFLERHGVRSEHAASEFEAFVLTYMNIDRLCLSDFMILVQAHELVTLRGDRIVVHAEKLLA